MTRLRYPAVLLAAAALDALSAMARALADHPDPALRRPEAAERLAALAAELAGGG